MTNTDLKSPSKTYFQAFRVPGEKDHILIPVFQHPSQKELYVIWSDITDCFPGVTRIQYANVYIPKLRDSRLYSKKNNRGSYDGRIIAAKFDHRTAAPYGQDKTIDDEDQDRAEKVNGSDGKNEDDDNNRSGSVDGEATGQGADVDDEGQDDEGDESQDEKDIHEDDKVENGDENDTRDDEKVGSDNGNYEGDDIEGDYFEVGREFVTKEEEDNTVAGLDSISDMSTDEATQQATELEALASVSDLLPNVDKEGEEDSKQEEVEGEEEKVEEEKEKEKEEEKIKEEMHIVDVEEERQGELLELEEEEDEVVKVEAEDEMEEEVVEEEKVAVEDEEPSSVQQSPVAYSPRDMLLTIEDLVRHRVKDILKSQYSWAQQNGHSRLFCFLPILEDTAASPETTLTSSSTSTPATDVANASTGVHINTKFQLYYLCDCYEIPGSTEKITPHWVDKNGRDDISIPSSEELYQQQLRTLLPLVGDYVMGVLEMLQYGVYIDKVPQEAARRVALAIKYLESKGIRSCENYMDEMTLDSRSSLADPTLDRVPTITVLDVQTLVALKSGIVRSPYERYGELFPYRTSEGDIRWLCGFHWMHTWSYMGYYSRALTFKDNPMSSESRYDPIYGIMSSRIKGMNRAREFFDMAYHMARNPVFTVWLDFDLTLDDEAELANSIDRLSAAIVHIIVRGRNGTPEEIEAGMEYGQLEITAAALRNPNIELITISEAERNKEYVYQQLPNMLNVHLSYKPKSKDRITTVQRGTIGGKSKVVVRATDAGRAIAAIRRIAGGMHHFSELLFGPIHNRLSITVAAGDTAGNAGCNDVEDTDLSREGMMSFLDKRQWRDEITYSSNIPCDTKYLYLGYITTAEIKILLTRAGTELRDLITQNRHLKTLTVNVVTLECEPSPIYETYKELISDHPTIETFAIQFQRSKGFSSSYTWRNLADTAKIRVDMSCGRGDNVEAMFQRYAPLIERLEVDELSPKDAVALMKSVRRKKKPLVLKYLAVSNIHLMDPTVREILQELIVNGALEDVVVRGSVIPQAFQSRLTVKKEVSGKKEVSMEAAKLEKNVKIWAKFLIAIRHKVTELYVEDNPQRRLLEAMEVQPVTLPEMTRLGTFHLTCATPAGSSLFDRPWLEVLLEFKGPEPQHFDLLDEDPLTAREVEIFELRKEMTDVVSFEVRQTNVFTEATLLEIAGFVPRNSSVLQHFLVSDGIGINDDVATALALKLGPKKDKGAHINLNGFVV
ncbi:hypothetical protein BGZ97_010650 [Linnemannia gamsii]|uniref:Uncharacterized protein n=1 Tax=Linnemannia gamsii TaxID=64522 RepID=A0A9P6UNQ3_9FUNG|nr:hypothetical protein BGZ97_010650 [Linnemannia gamsii]